MSLIPFVSPYESVPVVPKEQVREKVTTHSPATLAETISIKQAVEELETSMIQQALTVCRHNQRKAASYLGLTYDQFRGKIRKYGAVVLEQNGAID